MKRPFWKAMLSTFLMFDFLFLAVSGLLLHFGKAGLIWGFSRHLLRQGHFWGALLLLLAVPLHFFCNRHIYRRELKSGKKRGGANEAEE